MLHRKLLITLLSTLAAMSLLELGVRLLGLAPEVGVIARGRFRLAASPTLGYEPMPGVDYAGDDLAFFDYRGRSNSLGYRDVDHEIAKPAGTYRVVVLGDSIASGLRVERFADTLPKLLEARLRAGGLNAEVINLGVSGYNTEQEVETLKLRGLAYSPDLVLLAYCLNDGERVDGRILATLLAEQTAARRVNRLAAHPLLARSALYRALRYSALARGGAGAFRGAEVPVVDERSVEQALARLAAMAKEHDFDVLVAVFPRFHRLFRYRFNAEHERTATLAHAHGFHHLDLLDAYRGCATRGEELSSDSWHPTAAGHRCAADAIAAFLLDRPELASPAAR